MRGSRYLDLYFLLESEPVVVPAASVAVGRRFLVLLDGKPLPRRSQYHNVEESLLAIIHQLIEKKLELSQKFSHIFLKVFT